ncbi:MAG: CBS and ACT domain-containing protein [Chloroflexota bacterium]|nr:CBS and ACT domain-containing protein [Chloroflexota bacterium]
MLVKDRMTPDPFCGTPEMPVTEAQALMREKRIRHLPIVDDAGKLIGLVTQRALMKALPSDVSHFSKFEISYVLAKITVKDVMVTDVVTIDEDTAIEEAARIMADRRLGCLPVMRDGELIGIITDNDLFTLMVDVLGARNEGLRVTVSQPDRAGEVARISSTIASAGGYLLAYITYPTRDPAVWSSVLKVTNLSQDKLVDALGRLEGIVVEDVRVM